MDSSSDQTDYDRLFELLEPSLPPESRFHQCRLKLIKFFSWRRCPDPQSLADETILRLLKKVKQGHLILSEKPYKYVYAIAVNVFRENQRAIKKHPSVLYDEVMATVVPDGGDGCRELCLKRLSDAKLELLSQYYLGDRNKLVERYQLSRNALRLKIHRIKQELRSCCEDCQKSSVP
jgi:hypothetical protein